MRAGLYGSGRGNSFDADFRKCERYGFWFHQEGVRLRDRGDGAALVVGSAGHAWMEAFHTNEGSNLLDCDAMVGRTDSADAEFARVLNEASTEARGFGFELLTLEERADTASTLLHTLAPQFAKRTLAGESTVQTEMHGTLVLPGIERTYRDNKDLVGSDELSNFTVAIDRVFYHPGAGPLDAEDIPREAGIGVDEFKFSGMASPRQYAEDHLLNDQSLGYLYWLRQAMREKGFASFKDGLGASHTIPLLGVRYRVFRVKPPIGAKSYVEVWERVNDAKLDDWYRRKVAQRARLAARWGKGMDEWDASRYAFGPCHKFGRQCEYWALCDEPGTERAKIGAPEDANSMYVRMTPEEFELVKP